MLTIQGSFLVAVATIATVVGVAGQIESLAIVGLAMLIWLWVEWLCFEWARFKLDSFAESIRRTVNSDDAETLTLVTDRDYDVEFAAPIANLPRGYRITLRDVVPDTFAVGGKTSTVLETNLLYWFKTDRKEIRVRYNVQTPICGRYEFPGIQIELIDQRGLFSFEKFAAIPQTATVLPYLIRPQTTVSVLKHNNVQRHLGHHRHTSSGISSELHGIRDYRTGDPPRTIAWKPTARMGKLMTCEFENEVPIRGTVLVDLAAYQFNGRPGPTAGDRAISTSASIAKLLLSDRDPVAMELINDYRANRINHGSGERQLAKIIQNLLIYSNPSPPMDHFLLNDLLQVVFENAIRRFPQLFDERFNQGRTFFRWIFWNKAPWDRMRRALSVVLEHLFKLSPGMANRLQCDDRLFRKYCLKYVDKYNVVSTSTTVAIDPPYQDVGQWLRARNKLTLKLCKRLNQIRSRAKDNELFMLVAPEPHDLLGCEMLEPAIKQCVASGHQVMYIAPERPIIRHVVTDATAADIIQRYSTGNYRKAFSELGERLQRLGVPFARIDDPRLMQLVANEIGILQSSSNRARARRRVFS
ncbi:MAG: DUF58 domain-containing protein [Planctomycetota bacterium]